MLHSEPSNPAQARSRMEPSRSHGHHHPHHHHHNVEFLTSSKKNDAGVRITKIGLYANLGMAIAKATGGYAYNSQALTADAIHSLTDLISDFTTLATISYSLRPPTARFPTGYGKVESLGALGVSGILLSGGIMIGLQAVMALAQQFIPEIAHALHGLGLFSHGHSQSHGLEDLGPNINAAWLAGGSIVIKEWLYRATMKTAREKRSSMLASNAYHHRVDSLTAFVALAIITASHFLNNASWLDSVGGLVISGMISQAGYENIKAALLELTDVGVEEQIREGVLDATRKALSECEVAFEAYQPHVQGIKSGQNYLMEVAVSVPGSTLVEQTAVIEKKIRETVSTKVKGTRRITVCFAPTESGNNASVKEFVAFKPDTLEEAKYEHEHEHEHEHKHSYDYNHSHDCDHRHSHHSGTTKSSNAAKR